MDLLEHLGGLFASHRVSQSSRDPLSNFLNALDLCTPDRRRPSSEPSYPQRDTLHPSRSWAKQAAESASEHILWASNLDNMPPVDNSAPSTLPSAWLLSPNGNDRHVSYVNMVDAAIDQYDAYELDTKGKDRFIVERLRSINSKRNQCAHYIFDKKKGGQRNMQMRVLKATSDQTWVEFLVKTYDAFTSSDKELPPLVKYSQNVHFEGDFLDHKKRILVCFIKGLSFNAQMRYVNVLFGKDTYEKANADHLKEVMDIAVKFNNGHGKELLNREIRTWSQGLGNGATQRSTVQIPMPVANSYKPIIARPSQRSLSPRRQRI
jgi:sporulation protein YlmC with PRC-barrel domain